MSKENCANPFISKLLEEENLKLSEISKTYPYNALWAQLGDLYGAITNPIKLSKTIICGTEANVRTIEKLLNILTYFIRCSEIRRNTYSKDFDKETINRVVNQQLNQRKPTVSNFQRNASSNLSFRGIRKSGSGLTRNATTVKQLSQMGNDSEDDGNDDLSMPEGLSENDAETYRLLLKILKKNVMNDIPKVLAFRDSRFVKQELRIGNKSMDTGIEMTAKDKQFLSKYQKNVSGDHIKFTVTRPDSDGVEETIELEDEADLKNFISLSNLITANSLGSTPNVMKMFWGKEPYKEDGLNLEDMKHFERLTAKQQHIQESNEKLRTILESEDGAASGSGVVFVLGDNDKLVGLKTSPSMQTIKNFDDASEAANNNFMPPSGAIKKTCKHNKKHSGVKFNFEKYPQIATNYMKSKNLEFSEYQVLEKGIKMERENKLNCGASTSHTVDISSAATLYSQDDSESDDECECCANGSGAHYLQTPSNATELEFSSDQSHDGDYLKPSRATSTESLDRSASSSPSHFQYLQTLDENSELTAQDDVKIVEVPMLESVRAHNLLDEIMKPGFTTSLFSATSDHYIADMILQVTVKFSCPEQLNLTLICFLRASQRHQSNGNIN